MPVNASPDSGSTDVTTARFGEGNTVIWAPPLGELVSNPCDFTRGQKRKLFY